MSKTKTFAKRFKLWITDQLPILVVMSMIILLIVVFFAKDMFISIHSGEAGVFYRRFSFDSSSKGTQVGYIFPEGLHLILPWNKMFIYSMRVQTIKHDMKVLSMKGLPITLKLAVRFRPEYEMLGLLQQRVGPEYIQRILLPQIESVIRIKVGNVSAEDVYTNAEGVMTKILNTAISQTRRNFIIVEAIIIREIDLPKLVQVAIENKLVEQQILHKYVFSLEVAKKEALKKVIEANGIKEYQKIISTSLTDKLIKWQGVQATLSLSKSENAKVVVIGAGKDGLPIILGNQ
ncbi:MAG TPA: prohibitin family protein [Rhodospirillales bacterium]|nr:prohibitin family protein [Rhodospirillales bacterium]